MIALVLGYILLLALTGVTCDLVDYVMSRWGER